MGARLNQQNTSDQFYCKAAESVYRKLIMNIKYLYVELKTVKLCTRKFNLQEADFLNILGNELMHIKVFFSFK